MSFVFISLKMNNQIFAMLEVDFFFILDHLAVVQFLQHRYASFEHQQFVTKSIFYEKIVTRNSNRPCDSSRMYKLMNGFAHFYFYSTSSSICKSFRESFKHFVKCFCSC